MQSAEIELKFPVTNVAGLQAELPRLGFALETPRTFEHNTLYDTRDRVLRNGHQLLRIRRYGEVCTLTHKRQPEGADDSRYKTRIETETAVEDGAALAEIFLQLGYAPAFTYEKYRTAWTFVLGEERAHLVIDETPIGTWAELEGPTSWIDEMLARLGIDIGQCLTDSYGKLFLSWKERTGSAAEHLTFEQVGQVLMSA